MRMVCTSDGDPWREVEPSCPCPIQREARLIGYGTRKWEGFGGAFNELGAIALSKLDARTQEAVLTALFSDAGCALDWGRVPLGASDYAADWYSGNENEGDLSGERFSIERDRRWLIPYLRAARIHRPGLLLSASPWSPPTWMKTPATYNYGRLRSEPELQAAYALYLRQFAEAYRVEGLPFAQLHVQNEPNSDQKFPSCVWSGAQMRDFIGQYLGPLFSEAGLATELWLGTIEKDDHEAWAATVLTDPLARSYLSGVGYQWAGRGSVRKTAESWPDLRLFQTENECGDGENSFAHAMHVFELIRDFVGSGVVAYFYWNMVLERGGVSTWGWRQNSLVSVLPDGTGVVFNPEYYLLRHFSAFVRPGARIGALSGDFAWSALWFSNPTGERVIVAQNKMREPCAVLLEDEEGEVGSVQLPPQSITTLILT